MKLLQPVFYPFVDDGTTWGGVRYAISRVQMKANRAADEREPFWRWFFD